MNLLKPSNAQAEKGLRAMKTVLVELESFDAIHRQILETLQQKLLQTSFDLDSLQPIEPAELAAAIPEAALRKQFINGMVTLTMISPKVTEKAAQAAGRFAEALEVHPVALRQLEELAHRRLLLFRLDVMRNRPHVVQVQSFQ